MARMTKEEKRLENEYDAAFGRNCLNVQFDIMDLNPMRKFVLAAVTLGKTMDAAMLDAREKFRKNR